MIKNRKTYCSLKCSFVKSLHLTWFPLSLFSIFLRFLFYFTQKPYQYRWFHLYYRHYNHYNEINITNSNITQMNISENQGKDKHAWEVALVEPSMSKEINKLNSVAIYPIYNIFNVPITHTYTHTIPILQQLRARIQGE